MPGLLPMPRDPRDNVVRDTTYPQTADSIRAAKHAQSMERFAVVWPEIRKNPREGLKLLLSVYEHADDVLMLYDLACNIHGPAEMSRHLEYVKEDQ